MKFARALPAGSPFAARAFLAGEDARTLAEQILAMDEEAYRAAFRGSAMKRAKLAGLKRNARSVLANADSGADRFTGDASALRHSPGGTAPSNVDSRR